MSAVLDVVLVAIGVPALIGLIACPIIMLLDEYKDSKW